MRVALRKAFTLVELMVVVAVLGIIALVAIPSIGALLDLQQHAAVKELAQTYTWLSDEAALRNVTFRVAYNLDRNNWKVEVGDPNTLVFGSPEERAEYEEELEDKMSRFTDREVEEGRMGDVGEEIESNRFDGLDDPSFTTGKDLPSGIRFAWVYTPQYGLDGLRPSDAMPEEGEEEAIAYSYVFPDGTAEHTVVRIVDVDDEDDGYTLEVSPLTGNVSMSTDIVDPSDSFAWLPDEGPEIR